MWSISDIFCKSSAKIAERKEERERKLKKRISVDAERRIQLCEHRGELWLTFDDTKICPCGMFNDEPIHALMRVRAEYVIRKTLALKK